MTRLIIFSNGIIPASDSARQLIQPGDILYAANGGTHHALALDLMPSVVIGDMDSLTSQERQRLAINGVEIKPYPRDKDRTDLDLALHSAIQTGQHEIIIIGALGGRLDQTLGNLALLSDDKLSGFNIRFDDGVEEVLFARKQCEIRGKPADIVSLIPWGRKVTGICTQSLRWPLLDETLYPEQTRGISNEMLLEKASITLKSGLLCVVHHRQV